MFESVVLKGFRINCYVKKEVLDAGGISILCSVLTKIRMKIPMNTSLRMLFNEGGHGSMLSAGLE